MESVMTPNGPQVRLGAVLVRIKKPKLKDYKRFIQLVAELRFSVDLNALFAGDPAAAKPAFEALAQAPDALAEVCALASDATVEQAMEADIEQVMELFVACVKHANVVEAITGSLKKVWGAEPQAPEKQ